MPRSGGIRVQVEGGDRLRRRLEDLEPELIEACKDAIAASAEQVQRETAASVRVDSGRLRRTVRIRYGAGGLIAQVGWFDADSYYAVFHEFGTSSIPAQPALQPALEGERNELPDRIRTEIRRVTR